MRGVDEEQGGPAAHGPSFIGVRSRAGEALEDKGAGPWVEPRVEPKAGSWVETRVETWVEPKVGL